MPIFEFKCPYGHLSEVIFPTFTAATGTGVDVRCATCGEPTVRVPISVTNWQINHEGPRESRTSRAIRRVRAAGF